jgi:hypothetical protein
MSDAAADLRDSLTRYVPDGFRDEAGVWHDGPHRVAALAALDRLEARANDESDLEHQSERRAYWRERAEAVEERARVQGEALRRLLSAVATENFNRPRTMPSTNLRAAIKQAESALAEPVASEPACECGAVGLDDHEIIER